MWLWLVFSSHARRTREAQSQGVEKAPARAPSCEGQPCSRQLFCSKAHLLAFRGDSHPRPRCPSTVPGTGAEDWGSRVQP